MVVKLAAGVRKVTRLAREDGMDVVLTRAARKGLARVLPPVMDLPLLLDDIVVDTGVRPALPPWRVLTPATPLVVDWVIFPPGPGSGGHTTIFRVVEELERRGHQCRLSIYDPSRGALSHHTTVIRKCWPGVRARTHDASTGLLPADVTFATSWETAHVVARRAPAGQRMYFVQDFEPDFHPQGTERVLAEATYQWGLPGVTAGKWLAEELGRRYGMPCEGFDFGCDTAVYRCTEDRPRRGVVFYAKPDVPRRAFWLGALALREFARLHPEQEIHLFGADVPRLDFPCTKHGSVTPVQLNQLYNRCAAGLSLSLTNVSLVPWELLASGCTPVVNEAPHNRRVLDNPHVRWTDLSPAAIADALSRVVTAGPEAPAPAQLSASVQDAEWRTAGAVVERMMREVLHGSQAAP